MKSLVANLIEFFRASFPIRRRTRNLRSGCMGICRAERREISSRKMRALRQRFSLRRPARSIPRKARDGAEVQEQT
jgi:hypothetical protein